MLKGNPNLHLPTHPFFTSVLRSTKIPLFILCIFKSIIFLPWRILLSEINCIPCVKSQNLKFFMGDHMVVFKQFVESSKLLLNIILNPPKGQGYKNSQRYKSTNTCLHHFQILILCLIFSHLRNERVTIISDFYLSTKIY